MPLRPPLERALSALLIALATPVALLRIDEASPDKLLETLLIPLDTLLMSLDKLLETLLMAVETAEEAELCDDDPRE